MEFLRDRVIEVGLCGGMDLGWNLKRGNGPRSIDAIAWRTPGAVEVVDIGIAFDEASQPLALQWAIVAGPRDGIRCRRQTVEVRARSVDHQRVIRVQRRERFRSDPALDSPTPLAYA
jgi:hypothetical protein